MGFSESVIVSDSGFARLRRKIGGAIAGVDFDDRSVIEVTGWVRAVLRERGKIVPGSRREGKNIWTNYGRELITQLIAYKDTGLVKHRDDRLFYIGVGTGSQVEDVGVTSLITPVDYNASSEFLAPLDLSLGVSPSFPLTPSKTTVRFHKIFAENEITVSSSPINITEMGLFTNGEQTAFTVGGRDITTANGGLQTPCAYRAFEPIGKSDSLELEVSWDIRL